MTHFKVSIIVLFVLTSCQLPGVLCAEDVKITTYYPSPYATYKQLQVQNPDENTDITKFTHELTQAGLNIITDYADGSYTPGIFWSTQNENSDKPKAGIWMYETASASKLIFGTSNKYTTGITNQGLALDQRGNVGIGTRSPSASAILEVSSTTKGFLPPRMDAVPACDASTEGMVIYNTTSKRLEVCNGTAFVSAFGSGTVVQSVLPTSDCKLGTWAYRWYAPKCEPTHYIKAFTKYTDDKWDNVGCICCAVGNSVGKSYNEVVDACLAELRAGTIVEYGPDGTRGTAIAGSTFGSHTLTCPAKDP